MKIIKALTVVMVFILVSMHGQAQQPQFTSPVPQIESTQLQKQKADSIQRKLMKDSLNLSDQVITQVFTTRDNYSIQADQIHANQTLSPGEKSAALAALRLDTNNAIKELMGETAFQKYTEMIVGKWQTQ